MALLRFSACAAVLALLACDPTPGPLELDLPGGEVAIHSVLRAGADTAVAFVTRMARVPGTRRTAPQPLHGADVRLVVGADTVKLMQRADCAVRDLTGQPDAPTACYATAIGSAVAPGRTYTLLVALPDGTRVHGSTTVPDAPVISVPDAGSTLRVRTVTSGPTPLDSLRVRWSQSGTGHTELRVAIDAECVLTVVNYGAIGFGQVIGGTTDVHVRPHMLQCSSGEPPARVPARIVVSRFEANYAKYLTEVVGNDRVPAPGAAYGLHGAYGVFGAVASAERAIELVSRD